MYRPLTPDYGIDYLIEIFRRGKSTGRTFNIQLKGTAQRILDGKVRVTVKLTSLEYFASLSLPTLFVVYSTVERKFWAMWINEFLKTIKVRERQTSTRITLNEEHVINKTFLKELETTLSIETPSKVNIACSSDNEIGTEYHEVLRKWISHFYSDLFVFEDEHFPKRLLFRYSYRRGRLGINVHYNIFGSYALEAIALNRTSDLLSYPSPVFSKVPNELIEPLFLIANLFLETRLDVSLELYKLLICEYSGKLKEPMIGWRIGGIALENNLVAELQDLIKTCIQQKNYEDFQYLNGAYTFHRPGKPRQDYYGENLSLLISKLEDDDFRGMQSYNLANYYLSRDARKAIRYYVQAARLKPWYADGSFYWWREFGSALYSQKHFKCAERSYLKCDSISHEERALIFAWIGDCLFFQRKFAKAGEWIQKYLQAEKEELLKSYVYLTHTVIDMFIESKLEGRKLDRKGASSLTNRAEKERRAEEAIRILEKAVRRDPLCGRAWFELGKNYFEEGRKRESFFCFLACCVIQKGNRSAWLNALFLSFALNEDEMRIAAFVGDAMLGEFGKSIYNDLRDTLKENLSMSHEERVASYTAMAKLLDTVQDGSWKNRDDSQVPEE